MSVVNQTLPSLHERSLKISLIVSILSTFRYLTWWFLVCKYIRKEIIIAHILILSETSTNLGSKMHKKNDISNVKRLHNSLCLPYQDINQLFSTLNLRVFHLKMLMFTHWTSHSIHKTKNSRISFPEVQHLSKLRGIF